MLCPGRFPFRIMIDIIAVSYTHLLREKNGLTQKQVADMLNIDRSTYAYYESGKTRPDILTIAKLARLYRISTDFLLDVKPPTLQMELRDERMEYQSAAHPRVKYLSDLSKEEQDLILFYRQLKDKKSADVYKRQILHDIAKIEEFTVSSTGIASGYTSQGMLIGHLASGAMAVDRAARRLGTPQETAMLVEHMLLSHHGDPEFGAAVRPMFLEAELLSELDLMDARIYEMAQAVQTTQPNGFSPRQWALDNRKLYNHARREVAPRAMLQKPGSGMDHSEG